MCPCVGACACDRTPLSDGPGKRRSWVQSHDLKELCQNFVRTFATETYLKQYWVSARVMLNLVKVKETTHKQNWDIRMEIKLRELSSN